MSCVLRLAPHTDGRAILRHFKRDTTLALAGAKPVLSRLRTHCELEAALDPVLCKLSSSVGSASVQVDTTKDGQEEPVQADTRVRAVMALAPMGVAFSGNKRVQEPFLLNIACTTC